MALEFAHEDVRYPRSGWSFSSQNSFVVASVIAAFLIVPACIADVVPISIDEEVNASGEALACLAFCNVSVVTDNFSFSDSEKQPSYQFSRSGQARAVSINQVSQANLSVQQVLSVAADGLNTSLEIKDNEITCLNGDRCGATVSATNSNDVEFQVTNPALVHLTVDCSELVASLIDNPITWVLRGPGVFLEQVTVCTPVDETLFFAPGRYDLFSSESREGSVTQFEAGGGGFMSFELSADFTPIVPEPLWVAIFPSLLMILGHKALSRRRGGQRADYHQ